MKTIVGDHVIFFLKNKEMREMWVFGETEHCYYGHDEENINYEVQKEDILAVTTATRLNR